MASVTSLDQERGATSRSPKSTSIPDESAAPSVPRENFIPLRKADVKELILHDAELSEVQRAQIARLAQAIDAVLHLEYHDKFETLKDDYSPFDPDSDTLLQRKYEEQERKERLDEFFDGLIDLLHKANYVRVPYSQLRHALEHATDWGINLDVDFSIFERLEIYSRGTHVTKRMVYPWWYFGAGRMVEADAFQRLFIAFKFRKQPKAQAQVDLNTVYIKVFKNIPKNDIDMLLPGTEVRITWFDQSKILVPTIGGVLFTLYKILSGALFVAFAGVYGFLAFIGLVSGTIGYGVRSFYGYLNTRDKYHLNVTRNLYYQKLDSNAGVLMRVLDEAEEQEFREALIAYYLLWRHAGAQGWTVDQFDREAERWIFEKSSASVDFEITDALDKLSRWGLISTAPEGRWKANDPDMVLMTLRSQWESLMPADRSDHSAPISFSTVTDSQVVSDDDWGPVL